MKAKTSTTKVQTKKAPPKAEAEKREKHAPVESAGSQAAELIIITGMSGSGKGSVLRVLEDVGYYSVDNLPVELIPTFAELVRDSATIRKAALVVDVREGSGLRNFPTIYRRIKSSVNARLLFLEADDAALMRRFVPKRSGKRLQVRPGIPATSRMANRCQAD